MSSIIALVGAPNSGKTTLYNWLTNSKFKTVNYPGATVEYSVGVLAERYFSDPEKKVSAMDTPGTYSLFPKSADEEITYKALYEHPDFGRVSKVILVIDGTQLERHLLLALQMKEAGFHIVLAITMSDLLQKQGIQLDTEALQKKIGLEIVMIDGRLGGGVPELVTKITQTEKTVEAKKISPWTDQQHHENQKEIAKIVEQSLGSKKERLKQVFANTRRWDRVLLHPLLGLMSFVLIMFILFSSIFWLAAPFMDGVDQGFSALAEAAKNFLPANLLSDFLVSGIIPSFSAVFVFVPQIFILFFGIGLLEGSGYLARAATVIDKPFSKLGMSGRSFVPILSGFACAVPAMMATRNISSKRDRWITNFIIPLMTCSARLPVYALLLTFLFRGKPAWQSGLALALLYVGAVVVGALAAGILSKLIPQADKTLFMMELPLYRRPQWKVLLHQSLTRTKAYVFRAGPMIFAFAVLVWAGTTFPHYQAEDHEKLETSYLAQVGQVIEPVFRPMGVDWRVGVGLMSAFAAREVFVSSMAVLFNITTEDEESQTEGLLSTMSEATNSNGEKIFTVSSVIGLLIFFMIALQCMTTFAMSSKESGSMKFAVTQLVAFNLIAYVLAVITVQGLRAFGLT